MRTKNEEGLLRFDRMNENAWCFDMGYQMIYVETGMVMDIQLMDRFQRVKIADTQDNRLVVTISSRKNGNQRQYQLDPNKPYPARMAAETVEKLIEQAALIHHDNSNSTSDLPGDTSDLPF